MSTTTASTSTPGPRPRSSGATLRMLVGQFGGPVVPLADICQPYFALSIEEAARKFNEGTFPVPAFRLSESRKAPILVACEDLAAHIDAAKDRARRRLERHMRNRGEL